MWLPSEFNRATFAASGVQRDRLQIMPQPFDSVLFNPLVTAPMELPERVGASGRPAFAFLSVFKWEERKGWDVLLRAYLAEFARTADEVAPDTASSTAVEVVLYLRVSTDVANKEELARWLSDALHQQVCEGGATAHGNATAETAGTPTGTSAVAPAGTHADGAANAAAPDTAPEWIKRGAIWIRKRPPPAARPDHGSPRVSSAASCRGASGQWRQLPPVVLLDRAVPQAELPSLYRAVDAFVLPTRGEGWGRPVVEAMAMGLPAIATNWSGITAFLSPQTGYPLPYKLVKAPTAASHFWAEPDVLALRAVLRHVATHREEAAAVGAAARAHVLAHYSQPAVADRILARLSELQPKLLRRRQEHLLKQAADEAQRAQREARRQAFEQLREGSFSSFTPASHHDDWPAAEGEAPDTALVGRHHDDWPAAEGEAPETALNRAGNEDWHVDRLDVPHDTYMYVRGGVPPQRENRSATVEASGVFDSWRDEVDHERVAELSHTVAQAAQAAADTMAQRLPNGLNRLILPLTCSMFRLRCCCKGDVPSPLTELRVAYAAVRARPPRHLPWRHARGLELTVSAGGVEVAAAPNLLEEAQSPRWWLVPMPNASVTQVTLCRREGSSLVLSQLEVALLILPAVLLPCRRAAASAAPILAVRTDLQAT